MLKVRLGEACVLPTIEPVHENHCLTATDRRIPRARKAAAKGAVQTQGAHRRAGHTSPSCLVCVAGLPPEYGRRFWPVGVPAPSLANPTSHSQGARQRMAMTTSIWVHLSLIHI